MTPSQYPEAVSDRNENPRQDADLDHAQDRYTRGGWIVHEKTRWSASLCNLVAQLAGLGGSPVEG